MAWLLLALGVILFFFGPSARILLPFFAIPAASSASRLRGRRVLALLIATLTTNVAANVVSPANDFSNLWPRRISFKVGGLLTGVIGIAIMPWKLLSDYGAYIFGWLVGYSGFLGPVAGVLLSDYFLLRKRTIAVEDLYLRGGIYEYSKGYNGRAIWALFLGIGVALVGLLIPALRWLYDYAWFAGFFTSGALYYLLM